MSNRQLTLGSLFDGIGGFPLCAELSGVTPVWAAEVDPACVAVTKQRFRNMVHLGDVSKINGAEIPPVDIITFGSPCQDLSVAGARKGLKHSDNGDTETTRSGLFIDAIRIVYEMREATNGVYPAFIVWENVDGAFSSNRGRDFQTVLAEIAKTDIPMPGSGKWARAGMVRGRGIDIAWRTLDAQYWGVPQRRKRIYLIGSFGTDSAGRILFKPDSAQRYLTPRPEAEHPSGSALGGGNEAASRVFDARGNGGGVAPTITGDHNNRVTDYTAVVMQRGFGLDCYNNDVSEQAAALGTNCGKSTGRNAVVINAAGFHGQNSVAAGGVGLLKEKTPTLSVTKHLDVAYCIGNRQTNQTNLDEITGAFCMLYAIDRATFNQGENAKYDFQIDSSGINSTVVAKGPGAVAYRLYMSLRWIIRRLTPRECERLQGYPDDWTVIGEITEMSDEDYEFYKALYIADKQLRGKKYCKNPDKAKIIRWYNTLCNNTSRYRALGNSLAIPCALRVVGYIADYMRRN